MQVFIVTLARFSTINGMSAFRSRKVVLPLPSGETALSFHRRLLRRHHVVQVELAWMPSLKK